MPVDDTCQIIGLLGHALLNWGSVPPDRSQFMIFYRPDGAGYVEQCPWSLLRVTPPPPTTGPDPDHMQYFTTPQFSEDGAAAEVKFVTKLVARGADGRPLPPYINQQDLTLRKVDGDWKIVSRRQGPMT